MKIWYTMCCSLLVGVNFCFEFTISFHTIILHNECNSQKGRENVNRKEPYNMPNYGIQNFCFLHKSICNCFQSPHVSSSTARYFNHLVILFTHLRSYLWYSVLIKLCFLTTFMKWFKTLAHIYINFV